MRIPPSASPDVQQAFRDVWAALDKLTSGAVDMQGRRITNAGNSIQSGDLVTRADLNAALNALQVTK